MHQAKPQFTHRCCARCDTPICPVHLKRPGRLLSRAQEHAQAVDCRVRCDGIEKGKVPPDLKFKEQEAAAVGDAQVDVDSD
jgi:hypothetical protein